MEKKLAGRQLLKRELTSDMLDYIKQSNHVQKKKSMEIGNVTVRCNRCGHENRKDNARLVDGFYCVYCLSLGRVESNKPLYYLPRSKRKKHRKIMCQWNGKLTPRQKEISKSLLQSYHENKNHFVHAVTGAGKTEMLFPLLERALQDGKNVGIATPRIDVCLELFPRLEKAFPDSSMDLLYGHSPKQFTGAALVVCTTHQLMRFYHYFDVLVIDEVDAFPFSNSTELQFGAKNALDNKGIVIYLTATSHEYLEHQANTNKSILSRRYHGVDLPVPVLIYCRNLSAQFRQGRIPKKLDKYLKKVKQTVVIFFPDISLMEQALHLLKNRYQNKTIFAIHANSKDRELVVQKTRKGEIDILLSTTILERGVTFKNISVIVICAHHRVFNQSSLVQIAGRVGRHKDYPSGDVLFFHEGQSKDMKKAVKEIKEMNRRVKNT